MKVAVYWTLKKWNPANWILNNSQFVGIGYISCTHMDSNGTFPIWIFTDYDDYLPSIEVEIYDVVDDNVLDMLREYECVGDLYEEKQITCQWLTEKVTVFSYLWKLDGFKTKDFKCIDENTRSRSINQTNWWQ